MMEHGRSGTDRVHLERYADEWVDHFSKEKTSTSGDFGAEAAA